MGQEYVYSNIIPWMLDNNILLLGLVLFVVICLDFYFRYVKVTKNHTDDVTDIFMCEKIYRRYRGRR